MVKQSFPAFAPFSPRDKSRRAAPPIGDSIFSVQQSHPTAEKLIISFPMQVRRIAWAETVRSRFRQERGASPRHRSRGLPATSRYVRSCRIGPAAGRYTSSGRGRRFRMPSFALHRTTPVDYLILVEPRSAGPVVGFLGGNQIPEAV